jgi:hypothetical protein
MLFSKKIHISTEKSIHDVEKKFNFRKWGITFSRGPGGGTKVGKIFTNRWGPSVSEGGLKSAKFTKKIQNDGKCNLFK